MLTAKQREAFELAVWLVAKRGYEIEDAIHDVVRETFWVDKERHRLALLEEFKRLARDVVDP